MSAGFKVADEMFWGSNGAVEAYVEALAGRAAAQFGPGDPLAVYLAEQRDSFSTGRVLYLDPLIADPIGRERFVTVLDAATDQLLRQGAFTAFGREWGASVVVGLRARIVAGGGGEPPARPAT